MTRTRSLARCVGFDFGVEDHGLPFLFGTFEYTEEAGGQGFGYAPDVAFLMRFMAVFGVDRLAEINGRSCWVTHTHDDILLVEPLHSGDGQPFDVHAWRAWYDRRGLKCSAHELLTGEIPLARKEPTP